MHRLQDLMLPLWMRLVFLCWSQLLYRLRSGRVGEWACWASTFLSHGLKYSIYGWQEKIGFDCSASNKKYSPNKTVIMMMIWHMTHKSYGSIYLDTNNHIRQMQPFSSYRCEDASHFLYQCFASYSNIQYCRWEIKQEELAKVCWLNICHFILNIFVDFFIS